MCPFGAACGGLAALLALVPFLKGWSGRLMVYARRDARTDALQAVQVQRDADAPVAAG